MGLWDFLDEIGTAATELVTYVGNGIINVGKKVWSALTGANENISTRIGRENEYDRQEIKSVVDYASLATEYINDIGDEVDEIENECINVFKAHFENFLQHMDPADIAEINNEFKKQVTSLQGMVRMYVNSKCSSDNWELCEILEMPKGKEKEKKDLKYRNKILTDAINNLCNEIPRRIEIMKAFIKQHFDQRIATVDLVMKRHLKDCEKLKEQMESKNFDSKKIVLLSADLITQCDYLLHELNN